MNDSEIYQAPSSVASAMPPPVPVVKPSVITVFGALHLTFAVLGLLMAAWGILGLVVGDLFAGGQQLAAQKDMDKEMMPMTIISSICTLIVAVPMIVAGIKLVKGKAGALKWSNAYAYLSLLTKVISVFLIFTVMLPAMDKMMKAIGGDAALPPDFAKWMSIAMFVGALIGVVVSAIYPVMTLILLNRPQPKNWLAAREA